MSDFFLNDLGIACLIFWATLGVLLIWYIHKIKEVNEEGLNHQSIPSEAEPSAEHSLFESLRENEEQEYSSNDDLDISEQATSHEIIGDRK